MCLGGNLVWIMCLGFTKVYGDRSLLVQRMRYKIALFFLDNSTTRPIRFRFGSLVRRGPPGH